MGRRAPDAGKDVVMTGDGISRSRGWFHRRHRHRSPSISSTAALQFDGANGLCERFVQENDMTIRTSLAGLASIIAVGAALTAPAFAQDDLLGHRHVRAFDRETARTGFHNSGDIYQQFAQTSRQCSDSPARC
jgi:hypothetical protein